MQVLAKARVCNPWREERNPELAGYTGRIFETEVLGECKVRIVSGHIKFNKLVRQVRWAQPGDPYRPRGESANLHRAVVNELEGCGIQVPALGLFTAVRTPLDYQYGIDGFFSFQGVMVSVDCTLDENRDPDQRARVVVSGQDMLDGYKKPAHEIALLILKSLISHRKGMV